MHDLTPPLFEFVLQQWRSLPPIIMVENAFAKNLMAPIPSYPNVDSSLGLNNKRMLWTWSWSNGSPSALQPQENGHMCTNLSNPIWHLFCGTVAQILTKLKLIITRNGLTAGLAKFNLMQLLLKGKALQLFNKKGKKLGNQTNTHNAVCISVVSGHIFPKNALQVQSATCKRSIYTIQWSSASTSCIGISKTTILPYFPHKAEWHKRLVMTKSLKNYWICMKSDLGHAKKCQEWKAKKASSHDKIRQNGG